MQVTESEIVDMKVKALRERLDAGTIDQATADAELQSIVGPLIDQADDQADADEPTDPPDEPTIPRPSTADRIVFGIWQAVDVFANAYFEGKSR